MESLALLVTFLLGGIMVSGVVAGMLALRRPRSTWGRYFATLGTAPSLFGGAWLLFLPVGTGARLLGAGVLTAGVLALRRIWR